MEARIHEGPFGRRVKPFLELREERQPSPGKIQGLVPEGRLTGAPGGKSSGTNA